MALVERSRLRLTGPGLEDEADVSSRPSRLLEAPEDARPESLPAVVRIRPHALHLAHPFAMGPEAAARRRHSLVNQDKEETAGRIELLDMSPTQLVVAAVAAVILLLEASEQRGDERIAQSDWAQVHDLMMAEPRWNRTSISRSRPGHRSVPIRRRSWHHVPMAFDEDLAYRLRELFQDEKGLVEKRMFGGLAFLIHGHMAVSASGQGGLLLRVDPAKTQELVRRAHAHPFVMRDKEMDGWMRIDEEGVRTKRQLERWVTIGVNYARSLPPKK